MAQPVLMDFGKVNKGSQEMQQRAQDCQQVYQQLQQIGQMFQTAAALGAVGAMAMKIVTEVLKMMMQLRINQFQALAGFMQKSIVNRALGDTDAVPSFDEGIQL